MYSIREKLDSVMSRMQDIICILRSLQKVAEAGIKLQEENLKIIWKNSSLRPITEDIASNIRNPPKVNSKSIADIGDTVKEGVDRVLTVAHGLKAYTNYSLKKDVTESDNIDKEQRKVLKIITSEEIEVQTNNLKINTPEFKIKLTKSDKELLKRLDMEHKLKHAKTAEKKKEDKQVERNITHENVNVSSVPNPKSKQKLSDSAKQRKVPSSRIAGLGLGTASEYAKRTLGIGEQTPDGNLFMSKANMDRIVDTLCKVRGAALKLGQILSIQDESVVNPELAKALERVRKSADFMPNWQVEQMMSQELGPFWRDKTSLFAAASIGQVHYGKLKDGKEVAVKIQYPGVAKGIESDIDNLATILKMWNIFPKGMFLENLMAVAKRELAWEVDYVREAECTKKFKVLLNSYKDYYVPEVIDDLSTKQVFTTELLDGIPVDQCFNLDYEVRQFIGGKILDLTLMEILRFKYMQTDPNWANFLYSPTRKQILLLDFGASREYSKEFMDKYVTILKAACDSDRKTVLEASRELGFLTGYESKIMEDAHVDAVMILGEVFSDGGQYDFGHQDMTVRIQNLAQIMIAHRLCPPPEEVYSLHRKLSGVFLLCTKLKVALACRELFIKLYDEYMKENKYGAQLTKPHNGKF
ncbi:hypothetical protein NQ317_001689 [Molorchus minor]|uniref:ABC1 atypical kinase-like domain-containing protein n=1 Tax=Molorchus minor TaxID=1323400 RepID=A0ABQ9JHU6_9CUCU|nr:hypothetical protein NQ317_001689 [Molorchus minor]